MVNLTAEPVQFSDDYWDIYDEFERRGWTDGLPIVPPTENRIAAMLAATELKPDHVIGELPPRRAELTVEMLAINAVLAGCRPAYFPVVLTVAEIIVEPVFNIFGMSTTTNPVTECIIVNGPIRHQLEINCSYGFMGPGWRANATIGRAIKLTERNVGGVIPGKVSKATNAQPARYGGLVFGELEEKSPWPPFHTTQGFDASESTVTVYPAVSVANIVNADCKTAEMMLYSVFNSINYCGTNTYWHGGVDDFNPTLIVLCPDHANVIARDGLSREDVQQYLLEHARRPIEDFHPYYHEKLMQRPAYRDGYLYMHRVPEQFLIAVAGGDGGHQSAFFPNFGDVCRTITRPIRHRATAG